MNVGEHGQRDQPRQPQHIHDHQRVLSRGRIVVKAIQQHLIRRRADSFIRRFHQSQPHIARRILDAVEIARDPPGRRQNHDGAAVRVLVGQRIVDVAEAHRVGQSLARSLGPGKKVPALLPRPGARYSLR